MKLLNTRLSRALGIDKVIENQVRLEYIKAAGKKGGHLNWNPKSLYRTRYDIKSWSQAQDMANNVECPRNYALQTVWEEVRLDALLTSQIENRKRQVYSAQASLKKLNGDIDEEQTKGLKKKKAFKDLMNAILECIYMEYSIVELELKKDGELIITPIPRTNFTPQNGRFYADYTDDKYTLYRELPEYGKWILEFNSGEPGLINKAVPHVLFKRFAQSCWSELCEIYGIPPRVLKTNTQDPSMLNRGEAMMKDMGSAAWFIIDETESFEFAKNVDTNGDLYANLIKLCNDEMSLLISGAIIGQDTEHGNRSKEQASHDVLWELVKSDMEMAEMMWNSIVIPALIKIGWLPAGLSFEFNPEEDIDQLFEFTTGLLPYKDVDNEWIKEKFGVEVMDKEAASPSPYNGGPSGRSKKKETDVDDKVDEAIKKKLSLFFGEAPES
jgi:phage gp29-like protein